MDKAATKNATKHSWSDVVDPLVPSGIRGPDKEYKSNKGYPLLPKALLLLLVEEQHCKSAKRSTKADKRPERVDNFAHSSVSENSRRCPSKRHPNRLRHFGTRLSQYSSFPRPQAYFRRKMLSTAVPFVLE